MNSLRFWRLVVPVLCLSSIPLWSAPLGTAFTYQGRLTDGGASANGTYDLRFILFDVEAFGFPVGPVITNDNVNVSNGVFAVTLDFGAAFNGAARWLEIGVRPGSSTGTFTALDPRQSLTPAPHALYAAVAGNAVLTNNAISSGHIADATVATIDLADDAVTSAKIAGGTIAPGDINLPLFSTTFWKVDGNAGTTAGAHFVGTTDSQPLELKVNGVRAFRLMPTGDSIDADLLDDGAPAVIGGAPVNFVAPGAVGATIGGGGATNIEGMTLSNSVAALFGTISGGLANSIHSGAYYGSVGGGLFNRVDSNSFAATIAGGNYNTNQGWGAFIGGGNGNRILNGETSPLEAVIAGGSGNTIVDSSYATITGGILNRIHANAYAATISGGSENTNESNSATIAGGFDNAIHTNSGVAVISGGNRNMIQTNAAGAVIAGGSDNTAVTNARYAAISGGLINTARAAFSFIGGGRDNSTGPGTSFAVVPGGSNNVAAGNFSFAAGRRARANHDGTFVWADAEDANFASTGTNQFCLRASGGVQIHTNTALNFGTQNRQMINLWRTNSAIGVQTNTLYMRSDSFFAWYRGGMHNNAATNSGGGTTAMVLGTGGLTVNGTFVSASDRNQKECFQAVDPGEVLARVAALPITAWSYKEDRDTRHIGPMAQDFHAAFGVGPDDKHITTVDADGVALAAIQGLNQKLERQITAKDARIRELEIRLARLEQLLVRDSPQRAPTATSP
jgi:trimeric autotransporter adhesin